MLSRALPNSSSLFARRARMNCMLLSTQSHDFDNMEKARVFMEFFDAGAPMWAKMSELAENQIEPTSILDLGCGPGEPACHFAAKFGVPTLATDLAPAMVELAKKRVEAKGLSGTVDCAVLDMEDQGSVPDDSHDLVIGQMSFMFCPDKANALAETYRVMKPGGVLVANVWEKFELIPIAGGLVAAVTGPPKEPPPVNPIGPLSLADPQLFDELLTDAGFELTADHNFAAEETFDLGEGDTAFKVACLPIWDVLMELEESGDFPEAWATAQEAFAEVARPYTREDGRVFATGSFRIAVARKPE